MNDLDMIKRISVISDKHGWKDDDVCSEEEAEARIAIIREEDGQLWEQIRANTLTHALAENKNALDT
jgi:hypothetical protein